MSTDQELEAFETWAFEHQIDLNRGRYGGYILADTNAAWEAWKASAPSCKKALQVEQPGWISIE